MRLHPLFPIVKTAALYLVPIKKYPRAFDFEMGNNILLVKSSNRHEQEQWLNKAIYCIAGNETVEYSIRWLSLRLLFF